MWRYDRDRVDDPRSSERETQRLARDEYDRPRYGSPRGAPGQDPVSPVQHGTSAQRIDRRYPDHGRDLDHVRVHELMTPHVASVHPATCVEHAARVMEWCDCGALPVVGDNGVLVGMVTDRDITLRIVARGMDPRRAMVGDCMTARVFACHANESVAECMRQMAQHQVRRMPLVDDRGRLVGIVSQGDLARHAARQPLPDERRVLTEVVGAVSQPTGRPYR
ncbi:MAG TPA: CBS domain-containing protein [Burkholderiales bacterium]|nr:CBS domain-containing protein [Burkholderiales bacterium]